MNADHDTVIRKKPRILSASAKERQRISHAKHRERHNESRRIKIASLSPEEKEKLRIARRKYYDRNKKYLASLKKTWARKNPDKIRSCKLRKKFGWTIDDYNSQLTKQGGRCGICMERPASKRLGTDHCHKHGNVRGLLCDRCNTGLGLFRDDPDILRMALFYLACANVNRYESNRH